MELRGDISKNYDNQPHPDNDCIIRQEEPEAWITVKSALPKLPYKKPSFSSLIEATSLPSHKKCSMANFTSVNVCLIFSPFSSGFLIP
jgi:hypothetical protein